MILYILRCILEVLATIIAYVTNPIVVLFADEKGVLPERLKWWGQHDNNLDIDWVIDEELVPAFARYDFHKHYVYHMEDKTDPEHIIPGYVDIIDPDFTLKERVQRYICRLYWIYRNCNYGFSYFFNGADYNGKDNIALIDIDDEEGEVWLSYIKTDDDNFEQFMDLLWNGRFCFFYNRAYCNRFRLRIYLGWKMKHNTLPKNYHSQIALFIWPFRNNK